MAATAGGRSIRWKLTVQMLVVGLIPLVVLGVAAYLALARSADAVGRGLEGSVRTMEREVVGASLRKAAEDLAAQLDAYVSERVRDVLVWASAPLVLEAAVRADQVARQRGWPAYPELTGGKLEGHIDPARQAVIDRIEAQMKATRSLDPVPQATQYLKDQLVLSGVFKELFFTDRNGYNAAVSNLTSDFVQSEERWWVDAWTKGIDIGKVAFDDSAGVWSLDIHVRIDHPRTREPLGVMKGVLDISAVQAFASRAAAKIPGSDVKVMIRRTGLLLADTGVRHDPKLIMAEAGNLVRKAFAPAVLVARPDARAGYLIGPGERHGTGPAVEQVIGYAPTAGPGTIGDLPHFEGLGWGVLVGQDKTHAFAALATLAAVPSDLASERRYLQALMLAMVVVTGAGIVSLGTTLGRRITVPLRELSGAAERVKAGDLAFAVPVRTADEIGQLASTFNETVVRLRSLVQTETERDEERRRREDLQRNISRFLDTATEIAGGDLTRRGEVTSDVLGSVVDAINVMVEELGTIIKDVRQAAQQVAGNASEMIVATEQMATGAQAQAREAMSVSSATEELTVSVRQVAQSAEASATAARLTLEAAGRGEEAVRSSLAGMQRIRGEVQAISRKIKGLADRALEISAIVGTIEDIAAQTNLLSLNAAIEAAGAGEAGLRFAVVADEVRKLAERSAKAAKDIGVLIKAIQGETQDAVVAMEEGTHEVETGYRVTVGAGESLKEIGGIAQRSAELAGDISLATQQQVRGAEGVGVAIQSIAGVAVQTEQGVLETRKTMDTLVRLAEELLASLSRFKLPA
jgi:methyl-accepting chemotaxis protein